MAGGLRLRLLWRQLGSRAPSSREAGSTSLIFVLAVLHIRAEVAKKLAAGFADCNDVLPIYIGDDRTDEDAFKVLRKRGQGLGILVSKYPKEANASYSMQVESERLSCQIGGRPRYVGDERDRLIDNDKARSDATAVIIILQRHEVGKETKGRRDRKCTLQN